MNTTRLPARLLAGIAATGLILTGCAAGPDTSSGSAAPGSAASTTAPGEHNDADVTFAQDMLPHHRQAVEMAELAAGRSENPEVLDLAARIGSAQQPEIDTMTGWLQEWGAEIPADHPGMEDMAGMDHSATAGTGGMMTPDQMGQLTAASGPGFDRRFLELMTAHHRGAVEMAQTEIQDGADPGAVALAQTIIDTQRSEITEMDTLLQP